MYREDFVLYTLPVKRLVLELQGFSINATSTLSNGRSNYILFEKLVAFLSGLGAHSQGAKADLICSETRHLYEVKAYQDPLLDTKPNQGEFFQTSASCTFGANNKGPIIKSLLAAGDYVKALEICRETGYDHNQRYIYTNTRGYLPSIAFSYFIVPTSTVIDCLSKEDPRLVSRSKLLEKISKTVLIDGAALSSSDKSI